MLKAIKGSYSACYIRQYPNGYMQVVNMPAVSSGDAVLDSAANDSSGRWYVGYSYLNNKPIPRYQLTPNTMTLNSKLRSKTNGLINGDDNRGVAHGYENTGIVGVNGATGFIVGDHQIATAAHVVDVSDSPETNYIMTDISLMTYDRSGLPTGKKLTVAEVHMTETHAKSLSGEGAFSHVYDYALITVKEDLSDYVHFDIGNSYNMTNGEVGTIPIHVTGNPQFLGDDLNTKNSDHLLYTHYGSVYGDDNTRELFYTVDASGGQSGSPVYTITRETYNNTFYYTYTVLSLYSDGTTVRNRGPLMTKHHQMFYNNNSCAHYE